MSFLEISNLSLSFGGLKAVDDVSFHVDKGEVFTIVGPNGAGKSTIFNMISAFYAPSQGYIRFQGNVITAARPDAIARLGIARTFQNIELFEHSTLLQNLLIGREIHNRLPVWRQLLFDPGVRRAEIDHRRQVEDVIDFLELAHYRDERIANLPYGVRKKIELGRALCVQPDLLLLDEPASGLNPEETEDMGFWIDDIKNDLGITVLMIEHDMSLVNEVSDRVLALNNGRAIAEGDARHVQNHPDVVAAYLGTGA
ncbi:MAG: ABC transporter ATP-binding protein [Alphaproteobacteria bacterium]|nr:ABC transporter ATP-binding protein [Alphaproteobacteria bacterium]